jgi:hypothetical protein
VGLESWLWPLLLPLVKRIDSAGGKSGNYKAIFIVLKIKFMFVSFLLRKDVDIGFFQLGTIVLKLYFDR